MFAEILIADGDYAAAKVHLDEALALARTDASSRADLANILLVQGDLARYRGDHDQAGNLRLEALTVSRESGNERGMVNALERLAALAVHNKRCHRAVALYAACEAARLANGWQRYPSESQSFDFHMGGLRCLLSSEDFEALWARGREMTVLQAASLAKKTRPQRKTEPTGWASLTVAEERVVALIAEGLTNEEIAERLFVSRRTVHGHVGHIFTKLGIPSRTVLAIEARRRRPK